MKSFKIVRRGWILIPSNIFMVVTNEADGTDAFQFYEDAERKSQRDFKYLTGFMLGNITLGGYAAVLINALHQIFIRKNYNASDWYLPYKTT